jgi:hypothetical protein
MAQGDIASLQFSIDSSQAVTSMDALAKLQERAAGLAQQKREVARESNAANESFGRQRTAAAGLTAGLGDLVTVQQQVAAGGGRVVSVFDELNTKLVEAQRNIGNVADGTQKFIQVNREAESVARVFGQTADALVAYIGRTNDLKLAADATASSLDRITRALENQTMAGAQVRAVMAQYGVDMSKFAMNEPDKAVGAFIDRARTYRDTPAKTRDIQMVMGPMSPDDLNTLMTPGYVPMEQRREQESARDASAYISRVFSDIDYRQRQLERERAETEDYRAKYNDPQTGSQSADLAEFRRIAALPLDERNRYTRDTIEGVPGSGGDTEPGGWWSYITSGRYQANDELLRAQRDRDSFERGGPMWQGLFGETAGRVSGYLQAQGRYFVQSAKNFVNAADLPEPADQRPEDPYAQSRRDMTLASRLASYGETGFMGVAAARYRATRMEQEDARGAFREAYGGQGATQAQVNEAAAARAEADRFRAMAENTAVQLPRQPTYPGGFMVPMALGNEPPAPPPEDARGTSRSAAMAQAAAVAAEARRDRAVADMEAAQARQRDADQRYENLAEINRTIGRYSERPEERVADSTAQSRWLTGMGSDQRALGQFVVSQAGQMNVPTTRIENFASGADFLARGPFTDSQRLQVQQAWDQQAAGRAGERQENLTDQIELNNRLRESIARGAGAVEQAQVAWAAYTAEKKRGGDEGRRTEAAETALAELFQRNRTATEQATQVLKDRNEALERQASLVTGLSGVDRAAAMATAQVETVALAADRARPGTGAGEQTAEQERVRLANQARIAGDGIVASTREQLRLEVEVAAQAGKRGEVMEALRRGQQVDLQFQQAMAEAIASRDQTRIAALERQVALVKDMREQLAAIDRITAATQQLRVMGDQGREQAQESAFLMTVPPDARRRVQAQLPTLRVQGQLGVDRYVEGRDWAYSALPENIRTAVDAQTQGMTPEQALAFRRTIGAEASQTPGQQFNNPSQVTVPAVEEVMRYRTAQENTRRRAAGEDLLPVPTRAQAEVERERLRSPDAYQDSIAYGADYYRLQLQRFGDPGQASVAYRTGPNVVEQYLRTGDMRVLRDAGMDGVNNDNPSLRLGFGGTFRPTGVDTTRGSVRGPEGQFALEGARAQYDAGVEAGRQQLEESYASRTSIRGQYLRLTGRGETGAAQILAAGAIADPTDPLSGTRAQQAQADVRFGFRSQLVQQVGEAEREVQFQRDLGEAYGQSSAKVQEVTVAYRAMAEQKRLALTDTEREVLAEKMLQAERQKTLTQVSADTKRTRDQGDLYKADADTPWFAGPQTRARARAEAQADVYIRDKGIQGTPEADQYRSATEYAELQRAIAEDQQSLRQGFLSMGQAAQSAFADAVLGGKNLQSVIGGLLNDWARLGLQMASRQGFNLLADGISGALKFITGGGAATPLVPAAIPGVGVTGVAVGGVFDHGDRLQMYAAGEVIDRPTTFPMRDRRTALVGEAGRPEGIFPLTRTPTGALGLQVAPPRDQPGARAEPLPLTRLPNGDLAVQMPSPQRTQMFASGGVVGGVETASLPRAMPLPTAVPSAARAPASGRDLQVVNHISINGGGGGQGGKMDPKAARELEQQIDSAVRAGVMRVLADEKRQGGMLFQ